MLLTADLQTSRPELQTELLIPDLEAEADDGEYTCRGTNVWGQVEATFPVRVHGKKED